MYQDLNNSNRIYIISTAIIFAILAVRLVQLQLYSGDRYYSASEKNRVRDIIIEAPRGQIFARNGEILVDNRPTYSVSVVPYEFLKSDSAVKRLSSILKQTPDDLRKKIEKEKVSDFFPVRIKRQIEFMELSRLEEYRLDLVGVFHSIESKRYYPGGVRASHLFGYLGEITSEELKRRQDKDYRMGDFIGKNGVELEYESYLRGKAGVKYVEVDVLGREVRDLPELAGNAPKSGKNLYMTIDAEIQKYLENKMTDMKGAAVVLDPRNGEVLAILSKPDYDPEVFSNPLTPEIWDELVNHEDKPLYNRACQSLYPPGSTYKLVLAAAGLETGLIDLEEKVLCRGSYRLGRRSFDCWKEQGHGEVDLLDAIQQSCNVYFYKQGLEVGLENWAKYSKLFHFGLPTRIDLPNESAGVVPDREYFDSKYGKKGWTRGLILNLSVGQGDLLATPLQMAYLAMILGNEGLAYRPHLIRKIEDSITGEQFYIDVRPVPIEGISKSTYQKIKQGMYLVVNGPKGTGRACWISGVKVCGKTGTAQNPHGESHAWFIGFAPRENPEIAFCIMVENGGSGGAVAAPIGRGVLTTFFDNRELASN